MSFFATIAMESELEIERLVREDQEAKHGTEYDLTYHEEQLQKAVDEKKTEDVDGDTSTEDTGADDSVTDTDGGAGGDTPPSTDDGDASSDVDVHSETKSDIDKGLKSLDALDHTDTPTDAPAETKTTPTDKKDAPPAKDSVVPDAKDTPAPEKPKDADTAPVPESPKDVGTKSARESFTYSYHPRIAMEANFNPWEHFNGAGEVAGDVVQEASSEDGVLATIGAGVAGLAVFAVKSLYELGVTYGPGVASHLYHGVAFGMGKIAVGIVAGASLLTKYILRRKTSFTKLRERVVKASLELRDLSTEEPDLSQQFYRNAKAINFYRIGHHTDMVKSVGVLQDFVGSTIKSISGQLLHDMGVIEHIMSNVNNQSGIKAPVTMMVDHSFSHMLKPDKAIHRDAHNDMVSTYSYKDILPGNIKFVSILPNDKAHTVTDLEHGYKDSKMYLEFEDDHVTKEEVPYPTREALGHMLVTLEHLCDLCIQHQRVYETVETKRKSLRGGMRNYFHKLISSEDKISVEDSMIEYVYLKSSFVDKVYLAGMIDIHDYCGTVLTHCISSCEDWLDHIS